MSYRTISQLIKDFFDTGILKCNTYQLFAIKHYIKDKLKELEDDNYETAEYQMWLNLYEMIITYMVESQVTLSGANEDMKISFEDYLSKVYGVNDNEIDDTIRPILYDKYSNFIEKNCCNKCIYFGISVICSKCPCCEIYTKQK